MHNTGRALSFYGSYYKRKPKYFIKKFEKENIRKVIATRRKRLAEGRRKKFSSTKGTLKADYGEEAQKPDMNLEEYER